MKTSKNDARVMAVLKKMMGNESSRSKALAEAKDLTATEMQMLVALMTADRKSTERSTRMDRASA